MFSLKLTAVHPHPFFVEKPRVFFPSPVEGTVSVKRKKGRRRSALFYPSAPSPLTQARLEHCSAVGRKIYFFFVFFLAMVSSSYVLGTGGPTPSLADPRRIADWVIRRNRNLPKNAYFSVA
jgi:hypothetical protein